MGLPEGKIIEQAYVILLKLDKNKEVLVSNDWGNIGKKTQRISIGSKSLLNMTLPLRVRVRLGCFIHRSYHHGHAIPSTFGVNATNPSHQCRRHVQEKSSREATCVPPTTIHYTPFFHDRHPEPYITTSFSPQLKSFAPFRVIDVGFINALL